MSTFLPTRFGKYFLLEKLATGGMAQLYKAKITGVEGFEKFVALKTILPHLAHEEEFLSAFIDEAKIAALLDNQNVVQVYDFGSIDDTYFISMEYLWGKDLRAIITKAKAAGRPLSLENVLYLVSRVCAGLDYAHKLKDHQGKPLNIVHRDINPQNIFVTYEGDVKLVDFGIAKATSQRTVTQFGMIKGKVLYMSPEQASGKPIDHRSDIFSTGILLYEFLSGSRPFQGDDTLLILSKVREAEFTPLETLKGGLPEKLYSIVNRALAKDVGNRYPSCGEMLADIEDAIHQLNLRSSARGLSEYMKGLFSEEIDSEEKTRRVSSGISDVSTPPSQETSLSIAPSLEAKPAAPSPSKGGGMGALIAGAAVVIVLAGGGIYYLSSKQSGPTETRPTASSPTPAPSAPQPAAPPAAAPSPAAEADEMVRKAAGLFESSPEEAKMLLLQAIGKDPKNVQAHIELGHAYIKLKEPLKALDSYGKATQIDPSHAGSYFNMGFVHAVNKEYAQAERMYEKAVSLSPPYVDEALFNLAMVQEKLGKPGQSVANLEKAVAANPGNAMAQKALSRLKGKTP